MKKSSGSKVSNDPKPRHTARPLRIAVDFPWDASACMGTGAYSETMVRALARVAKDCEITLLVSGVAPRNIHLPNVRYVSIPLAEVSREGERQVSLPALLAEMKADCLFAPATLLPLVKICPMVATVLDVTFLRHPEQYAPSLVRHLEQWFPPTLRAADSLIAISEETQCDLVSHCAVPPERIQVIRPPVRETFQDRLSGTLVQEELRLMKVARPYFFHVSNLSPHKNTVFALKVFVRFVADHPESSHSLIFAGGSFGPNRPPDIVSLAAEWGIGHRVRYVGRINDVQLKALYQGCEAFLFPSQMEGWGLPVAEARSLGVPVLASPSVPSAGMKQRLPLEEDDWVRALAASKSVFIEPPIEISLERAGGALFELLERVVRESGGRKPDSGWRLVPGNASQEIGTENPLVAIRADWRSPSGLGQAARNVYQALRSAGLAPRAVAAPKDGIQNPRLFPEPMELYRQSAEVWIHQLPPDYIDLSLSGKHVSALFWETDRLPDGTGGGACWRDILNRLNEIWVATPFLTHVLKESGVKAPVQVFPVPIDTEVYAPGPRRTPPVDLPKGIDPTWTVFLYVGTWDPRKRPDVLIRSFCRAFRGSDKALLLVKTYLTGDADKDRAILSQWVSQCMTGTAHVRFIPEILSTAQMADLFRFATVFVTASRGEGYCMPAVQAMGCGKPVMSVNWSALADYVSIPINHRLEHVSREIAFPGYSSEHRWAVIDENDLVEKLAWVHRHRTETAALGRKARAWVLENASNQVVGARMKERLEALVAPNRILEKEHVS